MIVRTIEAATSDDRGSISDIFYDENINHVANIVSTKPGSIRGNHYHKLTTQHVFITQGSIRYWFKQLDSEMDADNVVVVKNQLVTTPALEIHALEILEYCEFIVFSSGLRGGKDYEKDTFRDKPIINIQPL